MGGGKDEFEGMGDGELERASVCEEEEVIGSVDREEEGIGEGGIGIGSGMRVEE